MPWYEDITLIVLGEVADGFDEAGGRDKTIDGWSPNEENGGVKSSTRRVDRKIPEKRYINWYYMIKETLKTR